MSVPVTKQQITDAVDALVRLMRESDDGILDAAHCEIARRACLSKYAATQEPLAGVCSVFAAEFMRRQLAPEGK
jgi:protein tyrosine phosphatase (PTP) superfamily phosphohydrolase (DUF442 family)